MGLTQLLCTLLYRFFQILVEGQQIPLLMADTQQGGNAGFQFNRIDGFVDEVICSQVNCFAPGVGIIERRHHAHRRFGSGFAV